MSAALDAVRRLREAHSRATKNSISPFGEWTQYFTEAERDLLNALPALIDLAEAAAEEKCECPVQEPGWHWANCERKRAALARLAEGKL